MQSYELPIRFMVYSSQRDKVMRITGNEVETYNSQKELFFHKTAHAISALNLCPSEILKISMLSFRFPVYALSNSTSHSKLFG